MPSILSILRTVHETVHSLPMKQFSEPKVYTGGVDINNWSSLTKKEKDEALKKRWYVYYSYRNPKTGKLKRQTNIFLDANRFDTKTKRLEYLQGVRVELKILLQAGYSPYEENERFLINSKSNIQEEKPSVNHTINQSVKPAVSKGGKEFKPMVISIENAFSIAISQKKSVMGASSFQKYHSRIRNFKSWIGERYDLNEQGIEVVKKKDVIDFLNKTLIRTSPRNRNNTRTDLSSLFQVLEDNDLIPENYIKRINVLKSIPERNKTYTLKQQQDLFKYLQQNDPVLSLFVKFVSYNFLRPIEVCRLRVKDIDLKEGKLYVRAKNKPVKTKIIPEKLVTEINIDSKNPNYLMFTPKEIGGSWDANENSRRDYFTKRFKEVKDHFDLGKEYGLYSFRHTYITRLYREFSKTMTPAETKGKLQLITGHTTVKALEAYLRDLDAEMPDDYSAYL